MKGEVFIMTSKQNKIKSVKLGTADNWNEVQCPYCTTTGVLTEKSDDPAGYGTCENCNERVRLINTID
jgi:hypothetical protein